MPPSGFRFSLAGGLAARGSPRPSAPPPSSAPIIAGTPRHHHWGPGHPQPPTLHPAPELLAQQSLCVGHKSLTELQRNEIWLLGFVVWLLGSLWRSFVCFGVFVGLIVCFGEVFLVLSFVGWRVLCFGFLMRLSFTQKV